MKRTRFEDWCVASLLAISVFVLAAYELFGWNGPRNAFDFVGLPIIVRPFNQARETLNGVRRTRFLCRDSTGRAIASELDSRFLGGLDGPHSRKLAYITRLTFSVRTRDLTIVQRYLRHGFCNSGPLADVAGCPPDTRSVELVWTGIDGRWKRTAVECG